ncbi:hypothetical protein MRB53_040248 [Persea americana]|nr:hypothetical protein MRB53_040248 [Persea americana]
MAFWQREWDAMAEELATGQDIIQHADDSDLSGDTSNTATNNSPILGNRVIMPVDERMPSGPDGSRRQSSKREKQLRKAAFYAADSLSMSDKLGVTFADFTSRELPMQSALCAFDCAQVLAEWMATTQERVDEDCKLLEKIADILAKAEAKMTVEISHLDAHGAVAAVNSLPSVSSGGYGSKILLVTAFNFSRSAEWPARCARCTCSNMSIFMRTRLQDGSYSIFEMLCCPAEIECQERWTPADGSEDACKSHFMVVACLSAALRIQL